MKETFKIYFLAILFLTPPPFWGGWEGLTAQNKKSDSLISLLKKDKEDTNKINHLNKLGWQLMYTNPDTSIILGNQASALAGKLQWKKGMANSFGSLGVYNHIKADYTQALDFYLKALKIHEEMLKQAKTTYTKQAAQNGIASQLGNIGNVCLQQSNYAEALDYYFKALKLAEELGNKNGISINLTNIGSIFLQQSDYVKALDYYFKALKIKEKLGNKTSTANILANIGLVYTDEADYSKALDYYFKALKIEEEIGDEYGIAINLANIGIVYMAQADYPKALDYYFKALKMNEKLGNKNLIATTLGNIGVVYKKQADSALAKGNTAYTKANKYPKALEYFLKALKIAEQLQDKQLQANTLGNIGSLYIKQKKYDEAEKYLLDGLKLDKEIGALNEEGLVEELMTDLYEKTGREKLALQHYKNAMRLKDTLFSQENKKQLVRKEMNFDFEKKELAAHAEQDKKDAIAKEELKQKEQQRNYFIVGFALAGVLAIFIFRSLRQNKKKNKIIIQQKALVDKAYDSLHEKNKEVMDSIHYAKRIQTALITSEKYFSKNLNRLNK